MMDVEQWRDFLYPMGYLSNIAFLTRFLMQWWQSEQQGRSLLFPSFWYLSLMGNLSLALHSFIQVQYPICVVQVCNAIISWRNLNLMQIKKKPVSYLTVLLFLITGILATSLAFALQSWMIEMPTSWFRVPSHSFWQFNSSIAPLWHLVGGLGYLLFSGRFWIQWWLAEKTSKSHLPPLFWWYGLIGAMISVVYFIAIHDLVNLFGPLLCLVPYARNLILLRRERKFSLRGS